ncbi:MAG: histidine kinase [Actinomycetia bacterium]|nr:histidine kinase [Actinomycetes bacterium]
MRRRILLSMVLVTAVAVALFAIPLGVAVNRLYRGREVSRLDQEATRAVGSVPATGLDGADALRLPQAPGRVRTAIYGPDGQRLAGVGPRTGGSVVRAALRGQVTNDHDGAWLAVAVPIHDEDRIVGAARAALPWDVVTDDTNRAWLAMTAFALVVVMLSGALAWWLSSILARPIEHLTALALRLGDGDFSARVEPAGVPEVDRAGTALNRTAARLGDLMARERSFTADVSHQLRTPLTSLRLALESALLTPGVDERAAIDVALGEVGRLQTTVATLLRMARDADPLGGVPCDPAKVSVEVAERYRGTLASAGRPLHIDVQPDLGQARCSADVLREILVVLLDNAVIHGDGTVRLTVRPAGAGVIVEVGDEGAGIPDPATVFRRRAGEATGHGIGLALARSLAEAQGGRLLLSHAAPHPRFTVALLAAT